MGNVSVYSGLWNVEHTLIIGTMQFTGHPGHLPAPWVSGLASLASIGAHTWESPSVKPIHCHCEYNKVWKIIMYYCVNLICCKSRWGLSTGRKEHRPWNMVYSYWPRGGNTQWDNGTWWWCYIRLIILWLYVIIQSSHFSCDIVLFHYINSILLIGFGEKEGAGILDILDWHIHSRI